METRRCFAGFFFLAETEAEVETEEDDADANFPRADAALELLLPPPALFLFLAPGGRPGPRRLAPSTAAGAVFGRGPGFLRAWGTGSCPGAVTPPVMPPSLVLPVVASPSPSPPKEVLVGLGVLRLAWPPCFLRLLARLIPPPGSASAPGRPPVFWLFP